jgi:hypothetical protein
MTERPHLHLVLPETSRDRHPASQPEPVFEWLGPVDESVFEWHGHIEHERGETMCCHRSIEITNIVDDRHRGVARDVVALLSTLLHEWDGYDVMILVTVTPPTHHQ